jgi:hypothetical protein
MTPNYFVVVLDPKNTTYPLGGETAMRSDIARERYADLVDRNPDKIVRLFEVKEKLLLSEHIPAE